MSTQPEDDGDLGLQDLTIEEAPSSSPLSGPSSAVRRFIGSVVGAAPINSPVGVNHSAHDSVSSVASSSHYHSADEAASRSIGLGSTSQKLPITPEHSQNGTIEHQSGNLTLSNSTTSLASTATPSASRDLNEDTSNTSTRHRRKKSKGASKRLSRFRNEIAGLPADRPLAGSEAGPTLSPRKASVTTADRIPEELPEGVPPVKPEFLETSPKEKSRKHAVELMPSPIISSGSTFVPHENSNKHLSSILENKLQTANDHVTGRRTTLKQPQAHRIAESDHGLDEAALQRWVLSIGCVNFDLERGPDLEFLYPSLGISREERDCMAFSSFPDTSIFDDGHAIFSWRVREVPLDSSGSEAPIIASSLAMPSPKDGSPLLSEKTDIPNSFSRRGHGTAGFKFLTGIERPSILRSLSGDEKTSSPTSRSASPAQGSKSTIPETPSAHHSSPTGGLSPVSNSDVAFTPQRQTNGTRSPSATSADLPIAQDDGQLPDLGDFSLASPTKIDRRPSHNTSMNYIHGFCYFRQKRDASIRRGYFQKSVVILSHLPYVSFFSEIVKRIGPLFFESGMPVLEAFCQDVQNWPPPEPGAKYHLPLLGTVLSVELPYYSQPQASPLSELKYSPLRLNDKQGSLHKLTRPTDGSNEDTPILASIPNQPIFEVFREALPDMWLLWECLILAEPILVVGPDPTTCSEAVWHMLDLIKPIPFAGDFRPFFTIHDHDFKTFVTKNKPSAGTIIGVTNPFMLQACKHWPHILKVGKAASKNSSNKAGKKVNGPSSIGGIAGGNSAGGGGPEHTPGLVSKRKRRVSKERALLKRLAEAADGKIDDENANELLRHYFTDLTERFLAPLNRYVSSLIPADFDLSSPSETPKIKPFNTSAFLASLKSHGTPLPVRSRNLPTGSAVRQSLYVDFIQCPNFSTWLHSRIHQSQEEQYMRKLAALESGDIAKFVSGHGEVETVDLFARLSTEIQGINDRLITGQQERELGPNSRWKSPMTASEMSKISNPSSSEDVSREVDMAQQSIFSALSSPTYPAATTSAPLSHSPLEASISIPPLRALVALRPTLSSAQYIQKVINAPSWSRSFTHGERALLNKKVKLIEQLHRLLSVLPDDLRQTLLLKERQKNQESLQRQKQDSINS